MTARRGLCRYEPGIEDEIFAFQRDAYPERREDWIVPRWRWMFVDSAARYGVEPMVWCYRAKSRIVAHQGAIPVEVTLAGETLVTGYFVETMVLEPYRGRAVGPMLVKKALEDLPFNLSLGQTEVMRAMQLELGWVRVGPLGSYLLPLRPSRVLAGKLPGPVRWGAAAVLSLRGRAARLRRAVTAADVTQVTRFGEGHDQLWRRLASAHECAVVRDARYLNWKYVDQPGQRYVALDVRREGDLVASVVYQVYEPCEAYRYRRALLADVLVDPADASSFAAAIDAVRAACAADGVDAIVFKVSGALAARALAYGFLARGPDKVFLVAGGDGLGDAQRRLVHDPERWLLTTADSDIDRPW